jgi:hypothetical protein
MFFKTVFIALAMIVFLLGAFLVEAVLRDRAYANGLLLVIAGIYTLGSFTALLCSLANL